MSSPPFTTVLQGASPLSDLASEIAGEIAGVLALTLVVALVAGVIAFGYRWHVRERVAPGLPVLVGLSVVAATMGTTDWLGVVITGEEDLFAPLAILGSMAIFVVAGLGALAGVGVGDRLARGLTVGGGVGAVGDTLVQTVGRVLTVELPEEIDDVAGYDSVSPETRDALAGERFTFPRRITVEELRARLTQRIRSDFAVGHVDVELAEDGTVEYLAVGARAAGIGPTLPPETEAVAVRADPAFAASPGDLVQVWRADPPERVLTAELRGVAADVVTLAVDAADSGTLDDATRYKLVTMPVQTRPDREFASLLRAADETLGTVIVGPDSELDGATLASVDVSVVAIATADGDLETLPRGERSLAAGDELYAIATPETLRKLEIGAASPESVNSVDGSATPATTEGPRDEDDD